MFVSVRSWLTVAGVSLNGFGAGRVGQVIATDEAIRREQGVRANHSRVARRDIERSDVLVLRLLDLVVRVGHIESRVGRLNVEVQCIVRARAEIESVEQGDVVSRIVQRFEFRRIKEAVRSQRPKER